MLTVLLAVVACAALAAAGLALQRVKGLEREVVELDLAREEAGQRARRQEAVVAAMSHELRTPMNGIVGFNSLLLDTDLDDAQRDFAESVQRSTDELLRTINDLVELSRVDAGALVLEPAPFTLEALVEGAAAMTGAAAALADVQLDVSVAADAPRRVHGDLPRLRQVLHALLEDTIRRVPAGGAVLLRAEPDGPDYVSFSLRATTHGSPAAGAALLLADPEHALRDRAGGTGRLGVLLARELVALMDGWLEQAVSPLGELAVTCTLPLPAASGGGAPATAAATRPRVLVVEDNAVSRIVAVRWLEQLGCDVDTAQSGADAIARASAHPFDLILMDCQLPELDGLSATEVLRRQPATAAVPIVAVTRSTEPDDRARCLGAGMSGFLGKPVQRDEFMRVVRGFLPHATPATAPADARATLLDDSAR